MVTHLFIRSERIIGAMSIHLAHAPVMMRASDLGETPTMEYFRHIARMYELAAFVTTYGPYSQEDAMDVLIPNTPHH